MSDPAIPLLNNQLLSPSAAVAAAHAAPLRKSRPLLLAFAAAGFAAVTTMMAATVMIFGAPTAPHPDRYVAMGQIGISAR